MNERKEPIKKPSAETQGITNFIANKENTMGSFVTNSIGMALLTLENAYSADSMETDACLLELQKLSNETSDSVFRLSLNYLFTVINEPENILDKVSLYLPSYLKKMNLTMDFEDEKSLKDGNKTIIFPLKKVLTLVWKALNDNKKYLSDETKSEDELQIRKDRENRLYSFEKRIKQLYEEKVCHQGTRNELVFLLNGIYPGIRICEDENLEILTHIKEHIGKIFWEKFNSSNQRPEKKQKLKQLLLYWMEDTNVVDIITQLDPENTILTLLHNFYIEHGSNPKGLAHRYQEALKNIEFTFDRKLNPGFEFAYNILNSYEINTSNRNTALALIKDWIRTRYDFNKKRHQVFLSNYYLFYSLSKKLDSNEGLLTIVGCKDQVQEFRKLCDSYFSQIISKFQNLQHDKSESEIEIPIILKEHLKQAIDMNLKVAEVTKSAFVSEIENFLVLWHKAEDLNQLKKLYAQLRDPKFQEKIVLNDTEIEKLMSGTEAERKEGIRYLNTYQINRFFLHAIITYPQWTELFSNQLNAIVCFVRKLNEGLGYDLKKDSYPSYFIDQLDYMLQENRIASAQIRGEEKLLSDIKPRQPPERMLLLPNQIRDGEDWIRFAELLNAEEQLEEYQNNRKKIDRFLLMLIDLDINDRQKMLILGSAFILRKCLKSIPLKARLAFLQQANVHKFADFFTLSCKCDIDDILKLLSVSDRSVLFGDPKSWIYDLSTDLLGDVISLDEVNLILFFENTSLDVIGKLFYYTEITDFSGKIAKGISTTGFIRLINLFIRREIESSLWIFNFMPKALSIIINKLTIETSHIFAKDFMNLGGKGEKSIMKNLNELLEQCHNDKLFFFLSHFDAEYLSGIIVPNISLFLKYQSCIRFLNNLIQNKSNFLYLLIGKLLNQKNNFEELFLILQLPSPQEKIFQSQSSDYFVKENVDFKLIWAFNEFDYKLDKSSANSLNAREETLEKIIKFIDLKYIYKNFVAGIGGPVYLTFLSNLRFKDNELKEIRTNVEFTITHGEYRSITNRYLSYLDVAKTIDKFKDFSSDAQKKLLYVLTLAYCEARSSKESYYSKFGSLFRQDKKTKLRDAIALLDAIENNEPLEARESYNNGDLGKIAKSYQNLFPKALRPYSRR